MSRSRTSRIFFGLVGGLLVSHVWPPPLVSQDQDQDQGPVLVGGWIPWDLAYPLIWIVAAAGVILFMTERVWREDSNPDE